MQYLFAGAFLGLLLADTLSYSSAFALYFLVTSIILGTVFYMKKKKSDFLLYLLVFSIALTFFIVRGQFVEENEMVPEELYQSQKVELTIKDWKQESEYARYETTLTYEGEDFLVYARLSLYPIHAIGETLCGKAALLPHEKSLISEDGKNSFDYDAYLLGKGIVGVYSFPKLITCNKEEKESYHFLSVLTRYRILLSGLFQKSMEEHEAHLSAATLFGSDELTKEESALYKRAGISHIVALSGFNISIIIAFLFAVFFFLPFWMRMIVSIAMLTLYLLMVGVSGSLLRATVMAMITFLFLFRGNKTDARRVLLLSGLILALLYPESVLHDASLQLSFLAMAGVLFVYPALFERLTERFIGITKRLLTLFFGTLSVTILIAPYTAYLFSSVSLYGILTTVLITFLVPSITVFGILFLLVSVTVPALAVLVSFPLSLFTHSVIIVAEQVSTLPFSVLTCSLSGVAVLLYYLLVFGVCMLLEQKRRDKESERSRNNESKKGDNEESEILEGSIYF